MAFPRSTALTVAAAVLALVPSSQTATITLEAGAHDRINAVVSLPWEQGSGEWDIVAPDGSRRPLQSDGHRAWFIETDLRRGGFRRYQVVPPSGNPATGSGCRVSKTNELLVLSRDAKPGLAYHAGPGTLPRPDIDPAYQRGGYLHPVWTPSGRIVTDDYPSNHIHHHGFWWAWTRTEFDGRQPDFWNMGQKRGRVDFDSLEATMHGAVFAGFTAHHRHTDLLANPPVTVLTETWRVRLYAAGAATRGSVFDLESTQRCATQLSLQLPKYHYGGLGYRGPWDWNGADKVRYLDSRGVTNRVVANETRPRWCWMGELVAGALAGVIVVDHPANFRSPQPVRVHPTEPYMSWAPSQLGEWTIEPTDTYLSRYRIIALDGEPDPSQIDRWWNDFADPALVRVE